MPGTQVLGFCKFNSEEQGDKRKEKSRRGFDHLERKSIAQHHFGKIEKSTS